MQTSRKKSNCPDLDSLGCRECQLASTRTRAMGQIQASSESLRPRGGPRGSTVQVEEHRGSISKKQLVTVREPKKTAWGYSSFLFFSDPHLDLSIGQGSSPKEGSVGSPSLGDLPIWEDPTHTERKMISLKSGPQKQRVRRIQVSPKIRNIRNIRSN